MKKLLFTIVLAFGSLLAVNAQFTKGTIMVGGSSGFSSISNKSTVAGTTTTSGTTTSFAFVPQAGYFVINNLAIGANVALDISKFSYKSSSASNSQTSLTISPFVRYYFPPKIYAQLSLGGGPGTSRATDSNGNLNKTNFSFFTWSLLAGYPIMLNNHVALEPQLGYNAMIENESGDKFTTSGIFLRVGLQVYLHK